MFTMMSIRGWIGFASVILVSAALPGALSAAVPAEPGGPRYPDRFVYVSRSLAQDEHVTDIDQITARAAAQGLNGMVLAGGLETVGRWEAPRLARLETVRRLCRERGIEIIPMLWSVGYGSGLGHDPNLAVGLPCRDVPFVAGADGLLHFAAAGETGIRNGDFETRAGDRFAEFAFHDRPGEVSFADTAVRHGGATSIRFEGFGRFEHGHARFMQEVAVRPWRQYVVRCWVRSEGLAPTSAFRLQVYGPEGCIAPREFRLQPTQDWTAVSLAFNSQELSTVRLYGGLWGGQAGTVWFDDLSLEPVALVNVLRRPGTPVRIRAAEENTLYEEGRDVSPIQTPRLSFASPVPAPPPSLPPGSRIQPGQRVLIDYYHGLAINQSQVTVCMSEPALYEYWRASAAAVQEHLGPQRWFLSMDEIRGGGTCAACEARPLTMGQILADCIRQQCAIIRAVCPRATLYIWSDMLDPHHNARDHYYLAKSTFAESWKGIPKDVVIACWYYGKRDQSLPFFADQGFATLAAAYYDADTMENILGWLASCGRTPGCRGIMYTTWQNKYDLLDAFGEAVNAAR